MNLGGHLGCRAERGIIQDSEIFFDGAASRMKWQTRGTLNAGAIAGIGLDQTGVDSEAFTADQTFVDAALQHGFEKPAQQVAVTETTMPVLREDRMIGHFAVETQSAEPAIPEVQVNLFAQPSFRADAEAIAHDQHSDQQFWIDRRPSRLTVKGRQMPPNPAQVDKAIDRPQQMLLGHMPFERELVEQSILLDLPLPHHRLPPSRRDLTKSANYTTILQEFFNTIGALQPMADDAAYGRECPHCRHWDP